MSIQVRIGDPDHAFEIDYNSLRIFLKLRARGTCTFTMLSRDGTFRPSIGQEVRVYDTGQIVWGGSIDSVVEGSVAEANPGPRPYAVECVSWEQRLDRRLTYNTSTQMIGIYTRRFDFTADAGSDVITTTVPHGRNDGDRVKVRTFPGGEMPGGLFDNIEYYVVGSGGSTLQLSLTEGGPAIDITTAGAGKLKLLTYRAGEAVIDIINSFMENDAIYPDDVELGAVLDKEIFDAVPCSEAIDRLSKLSNFITWVDADQVLHFIPKSTPNAPFEIDELANVRNVRIKRDRADKCNTALARVAWPAFGVTEEVFTGDGSTEAWEVQHEVAKVEYIRETRTVLEISFTADAGTNRLTATAHGQRDGDVVRVRTSGGTLPAPLAADTDYYVVSATVNTLQLETAVGAGNIDLTTAGSGTNLLITVPGTDANEKTFGTEDAEYDKNYLWNPYEKRIARGTASVLATGDKLIVGYRWAGTDVVVAENVGDIFNTVNIEGGSGRYHRFFDRTDKLGAKQVLYEMEAWVAEHADIGIELTYQVDRNKEPRCETLRPGQQQTINMTRFGSLETSWLIDEITISDVSGQYLAYDVRALSKTYIYAWLEFWKALIDRPTVTANLGSLGGVGGGGSGTDSWTRSFGVGLDLFVDTSVLDYPFIIACPSDVTNVRIDRLEFSAKVGPTGADVIADVNYAGVSILAASPKLVIPAGTAPNTVFQYDVSTLATDTFANGSVLTLDFDQIGSTIPGAGFICTIVFVRA